MIPLPTEGQIQRAVVQHLGLLVARGAPIFFSAINPIPAKSKAAAGRSKALGMRAGTPDIVLCIRGRFVGLEIKRPKSGRVSPAQVAVHQEITAAGGLVAVVRSVDEVADLLETLGISRIARAA